MPATSSATRSTRKSATAGTTPPPPGLGLPSQRRPRRRARRHQCVDQLRGARWRHGARRARHRARPHLVHQAGGGFPAGRRAGDVRRSQRRPAGASRPALHRLPLADQGHRSEEDHLQPHRHRARPRGAAPDDRGGDHRRRRGALALHAGGRPPDAGRRRLSRPDRLVQRHLHGRGQDHRSQPVPAHRPVDRGAHDRRRAGHRLPVQARGARPAEAGRGRRRRRAPRRAGAHRRPQRRDRPAVAYAVGDGRHGAGQHAHARTPRGAHRRAAQPSPIATS